MVAACAADSSGSECQVQKSRVTQRISSANYLSLRRTEAVIDLQQSPQENSIKKLRVGPLDRLCGFGLEWQMFDRALQRFAFWRERVRAHEGLHGRAAAEDGKDQNAGDLAESQHGASF
jgi:hypothetical protein